MGVDMACRLRHTVLMTNHNTPCEGFHTRIQLNDDYTPSKGAFLIGCTHCDEVTLVVGNTAHQTFTGRHAAHDAALEALRIRNAEVGGAIQRHPSNGRPQRHLRSVK